MGVFGSIIFSHTPEEAMSGGLAKACVTSKNWSCWRESQLSNVYQTRWEVYIPLQIYMVELDFHNLTPMVDSMGAIPEPLTCHVYIYDHIYVTDVWMIGFTLISSCRLLLALIGLSGPCCLLLWSSWIGSTLLMATQANECHKSWSLID